MFTFTASDSDIGLNAVFTYFINDSAILSVFRISAQNATMYLVSPLDFESLNKLYMFDVYAIDTGNRTGKAQVTVIVIDFNDNIPRFEG